MDRMTMRLRSLVLNRLIEYIDVYHGRRIQFIAQAIEHENTGIRVIKGQSPFEVIYVPDNAISELVEKGFCSFKAHYDTSILEYQIKICEE